MEKKSGQNGGFFDEKPLPASDSDQLIPRKKGLDTRKYGGYGSATVSFYLLVRYKKGKKYELTILPIQLLEVENLKKSPEKTVLRIVRKELGEKISELSLPLGYRKIKVNTIFSLDGFEVCISGKKKGKIIFRSLTSPFYSSKEIAYIKKIENFSKKRKQNKDYQPDEENDGISPEKNLELYDLLRLKIEGPLFSKMPGQRLHFDLNRKERFTKSDISKQIECLANMIAYIKTNRSGSLNMEMVGGNKSEGEIYGSANISNWLKYYRYIRIIDRSASGLFERRSQNLADLLTEGKS